MSKIWALFQPFHKESSTWKVPVNKDLLTGTVPVNKDSSGQVQHAFDQFPDWAGNAD